jgi:hypothetical protein
MLYNIKFALSSIKSPKYKGVENDFLGIGVFVTLLYWAFLSTIMEANLSDSIKQVEMCQN